MTHSLQQCSQRRASWPRESVRRITRKRGVFYFRRVLVSPIAGELALSLGTKSYRDAQSLAWALDDLCSAALLTPSITLEEIKSILRQRIQQQSHLAMQTLVYQPNLLERPKATASRLASDLREPFYVWREDQGLRKQTLHQDRTTIRLFIEDAGDLAMAEYSRKHISDFIATLRRLPSTYGKSKNQRGWTSQEFIEAAVAQNLPRLSERTVERHCNAVRQFFRFAYDQAEIGKDHLEITKGFTFKASSARNQRSQWEVSELEKLFRSPIWTGRSEKRRTKAGGLIVKDAYFWLPLLGVYHGNRLEEFAQLLRCDVKCESGIWCLVITDGGEGQQLKNDPSRRIVPLHPVLRGMGFIEYVETIAPLETDPIFPDLPPSGVDNKRGFFFSKRFSYYRIKIGVKRGRDYHSFRHNVTTQLLNNGVPEHLVDLLTGHQGDDGETIQRYFKGAPVELLHKAIASVWWEELDFSHLMQPGVNYRSLKAPFTQT